MDTTHTVFFVGKPGCGKGTQSKLLAKRTGWHLFAAGKLFREIAKEETVVGRKIKQETEAGMLAPPWFAMHLYLKTLLSVKAEDSVIFDGFNRKIDEARLVIDSLAWLSRPCQVIYIDISDEEVHRRLDVRKETSGRADDHAVDERLKEYRTYTEPALALFRSAGVLIDIDGEQSPEKIAEDIRAALALA